MRTIICIILSVALSACATKYSKPPTGIQYATITITGNASGITTSTLFVACKEEICTNSKGGDWLAVFNWANKEKVTAYVAARERIRIKAFAANNLTGVSSYGSQSFTHGSLCTNEFSFVPEPDHNYSLSQELTSTYCRIKIIDSRTGQLPGSFMTN